MGALRSFLLLLLGLFAGLAPATLKLHAATTDDMVIYADRFHNGWGDNWSYTTRYATNNPVHSGSNSMAILPSATWEAWWLKAGTKVDMTIYTNLSLWVYGTTSGQNIKVYSELDGNNAGLPSVTVAITPNAWQQVAISLNSLGVNAKTNLTGFRIEAATAPSRDSLMTCDWLPRPHPPQSTSASMPTKPCARWTGKFSGSTRLPGMGV